MKKIISSVGAFVLCLMVSLIMVGCGDAKAQNTVTMSVNPEVTFVVDANNKVISFACESNDAERIFSNVEFVGKDIDDTVQIFVELSAISGHIDLTGTNNFNISVSGDVNVKELKNKIEEKTKAVFKEIGATVKCTAKTITKDSLIATAKALAPEVSTVNLKSMETEELVKLISDKQKDYAGLAYSQINDVFNNTSLKVQEVALQTADKAFTAAQEALDAAKDISAEAKQELQNTLNETKKAFNKVVVKFNEVKNQLIQEAKEHYATLKTKLEDDFKAEVDANKTTFKAHLDDKVNSGNIKAEQANYYKSLADKYLK